MAINKPLINYFFADSGTLGDGITDANVITLSGTADANTTVKIYDGSTVLGTVTTNSSGIWLFETPKLSDTTHSLTATATDTSGASATSDPFSVKVVPSVTDFRPASDNWSNPIKIDGQGWYVENGNKAWSLTNPDAHTVRMEVRPGDTWADDDTARSEILTATNALDHQVFNASFTLTVEPGQKNDVAWLSLAQMHEDAGIPFSIQLVGDKMTVLTDQNASWGGVVYSDPNQIVRGHAYDIQIKANFSTDSTGFLQIWRDGVQIVDYHGKLGSETGGQYLKLGIYEGWPEDVQYATAVDYSNIVVTYNNPNVPTPSSPGNGNTGSGGGNTGGSTQAPAAPTIAKFSTDSGVAGDKITSDNTLTVTGTAAANSTVKVFDGTKQLGTATAGADGAWNYVTSVLTDAVHVLTATATNAGGQTSAASAALNVTIDTHAPVAPTIAASTPAASLATSNTALLTGNAEANSTVKLFDGTTQIGTATANGNGAWTYTTAALSTGSHSFTAKAMDAAGNTGSASTAAIVNITAPTTPAPSAPKIATFSTDSGVAGDHITNDSTLILTGTAAASSLVKVFDGSVQVGTANADSNGQWTYTTKALSDGGHSLTATATDALGHTSAASSALSVTLDTHAPLAPTMSVYSQAGSAVGSTTTLDDLVLKGTAEANSTVKVFDGTAQIGTATASASGAWNFDTGHLDSGSHSFTSKAVDAAGNVGSASAATSVGIAAPPASTPTAGVDLTDLSKGSWNSVTIKGTADPNSAVKIYDGDKAIGSATASSDGNWAYTTKLGYSNGVHTYSAQEIDSAGNVVAKSSGQAIVGSSYSNKMASTAGDDLFVGNGGSDTFTFAANFGNDVIRDFDAIGRRHDVVEFSKTEFDSLASVLSHASQVGQDVVISAGSDTLTLKNTKLGALDSHDFHFA